MISPPWTTLQKSLQVIVSVSIILWGTLIISTAPEKVKGAPHRDSGSSSHLMKVYFLCTLCQTIVTWRYGLLLQTIAKFFLPSTHANASLDGNLNQRFTCDSVNKECIWNALRKRDIPEEMIGTIIKATYEGAKQSVLHWSKIWEKKKSRQNCILSSILSLFVISDILQIILFGGHEGTQWSMSSFLKHFEYVACYPIGSWISAIMWGLYSLYATIWE